MPLLISPVIAGKLFDRYYTVEVNDNSTDLGLSIAKTLTQRMGGRMEADYNNKRLSVTVRFPA